MDISKRNYWVGSIYIFSLFSGFAFIYSMYAIWLSQTVQLSGSQIGLIFSANSIAAISVQPLLGFVQDKLGTKQYLLWLNALFLLVSGPFFSFIYAPLLISEFYLGLAVGALFVAFVFLAMAGVVETFLERLSRLSKFEFGRLRLWGSLGWASAALFGGLLINLGGEVIFWCASAVSIIPIFILAFIRFTFPKTNEDLSSESVVNLNDVMRILKLPSFYCFAFYVLGVATIYTVYDQQFPVFFASLFDDVTFGNSMFGYLNSTQIFLEAACFAIAPLLVNRLGVKNGLLLAGGIMVFRIFTSALVDNEIALGITKLLHAIELPVLMVSIFKYLNLHFNPKLSATLFLIGFMFVMQLGSAAFAPIFGYLYDVHGFQAIYLIMACISFVSLLISSKLLSNDSESERPISYEK